MERRTVILLGKSMLISLVGASISQSKQLRVEQADSWAELEILAAECPPDILIYEQASAYEGHILSLLHQHPHLVLMELDEETNRGMLITGQETCPLTIGRVIEIIESRKRQ